MTRKLYNKFDKKLIAPLTRVVFPGKIVTILSAGETINAVNYLLSQPILGVDTETRPSFHKGEQHKVSLLQVASHDICFLFRLNLIGLTPSIIKLLENRQVPMIGLSWHDDLLALHRRGNFTPGYFIDLQDVVPKFGIEDLSLQKLYANVFGQKISKRQQLSNWDADVLSDKQKIYAATDAWACIKLYEEFQRLKESGDYELIKVPEPEPKQPVKDNVEPSNTENNG